MFLIVVCECGATLVKVKIPVREIKFGMFVEGLDRSWLDTSFPFQGFRISSVDEIERLQNYCDYVFVNTEKSRRGSATHLMPKPPSSEAMNSILQTIAKRRKASRIVDREILGQENYAISMPVERALSDAVGVRKDARAVIDNLYDSARIGSSIDTGYAKSVVEDLTDGILQNPDAHMLLTKLHSRDEYTAIHSLNVCTLSIAFGRHLGLPESFLKELGLGAMLHDLGKSRVPPEILNKPGKLTEEEFEVIKSHPIFGMEMLLEHSNPIPPRAIDIAYTHHERMDGSGYPQGLEGKEIPLYGRIVSIVDYYDAVTSDRCYHDGASPDVALRQLFDNEGWHDQELVESFIRCLSIFPVGSIVECDNGEVAIVLSQNESRRLRPKLLLVMNEYKRFYDIPKIIDLSLFDDENQTSIKRLTRPGEYGIDVRRYLKELNWLPRIKE